MKRREVGCAEVGRAVRMAEAFVLPGEYGRDRARRTLEPAKVRNIFSDRPGGSHVQFSAKRNRFLGTGCVM